MGEKEPPLFSESGFCIHSKLLLEGLADDLHGQWSNEGHYTRNVKRGAKAEEAFPEFITRKGRVI